MYVATVEVYIIDMENSSRIFVIGAGPDISKLKAACELDAEQRLEWDEFYSPIATAYKQKDGRGFFYRIEKALFIE